jgi:hypothetical protein
MTNNKIFLKLVTLILKYYNKFIIIILLNLIIILFIMNNINTFIFVL